MLLDRRTVRQLNAILSVGALVGIAAVGVVRASQTVTTPGSVSTNAKNSNNTNCVWAAWGTAHYNKGDYMGMGMYYISLPAADPCVWEGDVASYTTYTDAEMYARMVFDEAAPTGTQLRAESCPQNALDQVFPYGSIQNSPDMMYSWSPQSQWWATDNSVQCFFKIQSYGAEGGWAASQVAL